MHKLQKTLLHAAGVKSTDSSIICRLAEFYLSQECTLNVVGRRMFCTPVYFVDLQNIIFHRNAPTLNDMGRRMLL
jgi:hypothetical protein